MSSNAVKQVTRGERLAMAVRELKFHPSASHIHPERRDGYNEAIEQVARLISEHPPEDVRIRRALEKLLRAEEKYVRDTGLPQPDDLIQQAVNEARMLLGWPAVCSERPTPVDRPTCGKAHGMCAMLPDANGTPATGTCPECGHA